MDWRATAPQEVQQDFDMLLRDAVDAVAQILAEADSFAPLMLVIDQSGRKGMRSSQPRDLGTDEQAIIDRLQIGGDRIALRARASVFDVTVSAPFAGSAIKTVLEHRAGWAVDVLVPYLVSPAEIRIDLDAANGAVGTRRLWS
ncbi:hypothetical protein [Nocardia sp. NPDC051832]|uniref:hypothetical protein n=1 Tax=Nocardia sp. NPDC051832 TaxID=3155673 RepID=UPI003434BD98